QNVPGSTPPEDTACTHTAPSAENPSTPTYHQNTPQQSHAPPPPTAQTTSHTWPPPTRTAPAPTPSSCTPPPANGDPWGMTPPNASRTDLGTYWLSPSRPNIHRAVDGLCWSVGVWVSQVARFAS